MRASKSYPLVYLVTFILAILLTEAHESVNTAEVDANAWGAFDDDLMATDDDYLWYDDDDYHDIEKSYQDEASHMEEALQDRHLRYHRSPRSSLCHLRRRVRGVAPWKLLSCTLHSIAQEKW